MSRPPLRILTLVVPVLGTIAALTLPGCGGGTATDVWPADRTGPRVLVSFAPYYCFAANVAGDDAIVRSLMTTSGPHHFQPDDRDALLLRKATVFFTNGLGLEGEMPENLKRGSGNTGLKIVAIGDMLPANMLCDPHHDEDDDDDKDEKGKDDHHEHHHHGAKDPHFWLSPECAIVAVNAIRDELKSSDAAHAANYDRRAAEYVEKLKRLKEEGVALLKDKKDRRMVTFHESLPYFAKAFDLTIVEVVEKTPGTEPTDKQLKKIIAVCSNKEHPVRLLTVEPQYSNSSSGEELVKILKNKGVPDPALVEFDTLETVVPDQLTPDWYENKMRANLKALAEKMK